MKTESGKKKFSGTGLSFSVVASRLKAALGVKTDVELADALGMSSSNFANRKAAESVPVEQIVALAASRKLSLDWLFFGLGEQELDGVAHDASTVFAIDEHLLHKIAAQLRQGFGEAQAEVPNFADEWSVAATLSAYVYNQVIGISDIKERERRIAESVPFVVLMAGLPPRKGRPKKEPDS